MALVGLVAALVAGPGGCGGGQAGSGDAVRRDDRPPAGGPSYTRLRRQGVIDRHGFGQPIEAFSVLVPADWRFDGRIEWNPNGSGCPLNLVTASVRAASPDGHLGFEVFPNHAWGWVDDPAMREMAARQEMMTGIRGCDMAPPVGAAEYLQRFILPQHRDRAQVIESRPDPGVAGELERAGRATLGTLPAVQDMDVRTDAARLRVAYSAGGQALEEWLLCTVFHIITSMPSPSAYLGYGGQPVTQTVSSSATNLYGLWAPSGELSAHERLFSTILASIHTNPAWEAAVQRTVNQIAATNLQGTMDRARIWSETSREISGMQQRSWEERQASQDRIAGRWSRTIRGVESYNDPLTHESVELSSGYVDAWSNGVGEYILSDDPNFDPNVELRAGNWERMDHGR